MMDVILRILLSTAPIPCFNHKQFATIKSYICLHNLPKTLRNSKEDTHTKWVLDWVDRRYRIISIQEMIRSHSKSTSY